MQTKERVMGIAESPQEARDAVRRTTDRAGARVALQAGKAGTRLGARGALFGAKAAVREKLRPARDAKLKAQLAETSRELANETSDLGDAVGSLNQVIKANRRAGAHGRTRTIIGIAVGTVVTYHLDPQNGRERRHASAKRLRRLASRSV
jgi:hypothetical protein